MKYEVEIGYQDGRQILFPTTKENAEKMAEIVLANQGREGVSGTADGKFNQLMWSKGVVRNFMWWCVE